MFTKATYSYLALSLLHFLCFLSWKAQICPGITWWIESISRRFRYSANVYGIPIDSGVYRASYYMTKGRGFLHRRGIEAKAWGWLFHLVPRQRIVLRFLFMSPSFFRTLRFYKPLGNSEGPGLILSARSYKISLPNLYNSSPEIG
jgi:hypothetical protein